MRILHNILYVTTPGSYLALDGENAVIRREGAEAGRIPLLNLEGIVVFGYLGASPALLGACSRRGIAVSFLTPNGRFLARVSGPQQGNVMLRKTQYRISDDDGQSTQIAKRMVAAKLYNSRWVIERAVRDHALRVNVEQLRRVSQFLGEATGRAAEAETLAALRGQEGEGAAQYFSVFDQLILQNKETFFFNGRSRRPPMDAANALLSFVYTLLAHDTAAALETVGLDPYVGFLHRDRPGRLSLALDLMEELRPVMADRFVLSLINRRMVAPKGFSQEESGAVWMDENTRRIVIAAWQERKQETIQHPYLQEKILWGLVPYAQALLLSRYFRGDLDAYPPFLWK